MIHGKEVVVPGERRRVMAAKRALPEHEVEVELRAQLGLKRGGFWASKSDGGPAHFWLDDALQEFPAQHSRPLVGLLCSAMDTGNVVARWFEKTDLGKRVDPRKAKRVCATCRRIVVEEDL